MADNSQIIQKWIQALNQAYSNLKPISSLSDAFGSISIEDAYQIQLQLLEDRIKRGERLIGWKIGATSSAIRNSFSFPVSEPVFGWMTDKSDYSGLDEISISSFCNLRMEAEIGLIFNTPLKGPDITGGDVTNAASGVMATIELVGGRSKERKTLSDLVADNSGHAGIIFGPLIKPVTELDLSHEEVTICKNGHIQNKAYGSEVMGNPINAVCWLVNKLAQFGYEVSSGNVISTGSLTKVITLGIGDIVDVSFANLGGIHFKVIK